jgi:hypothetical protein
VRASTVARRVTHPSGWPPCWAAPIVRCNTEAHAHAVGASVTRLHRMTAEWRRSCVRRGERVDTAVAARRLSWCSGREEP